MKIRAPAKINLGLKILGKRPDGFHELETIFAEIGFFDELDFRSRKDGKIELQIPNTKDQTPNTLDNLVHRAAKLLQKLAPKNSGATIRLAKNIPIGAGLGGGSSDAAATLRALNRIWNLKLSRKKLETLGAKLGSDVPFFIRGGVRKGSGRGEKLRAFKLPKRFPRHVVLIVPKKIRVSTAWAYGQFSISNFQFPISKKKGFYLDNDFESIVFRKFPRLKRIKSALEKAGAKHASLSGSGSAFYGLFEKAPRREQLKRLAKLGEINATKLRTRTRANPRRGESARFINNPSRGTRVNLSPTFLKTEF